MDKTTLQTIPYAKFGDHRGYLALSPIEADDNWVQENVSQSIKGVLRGMHLQKEASAQTKLVRVLYGKALDVVIDLRPDSPDYLKVSAFELSPETPEYLLVPKGFAHGFVTLEDDTIFQYRVDYGYDKDAESSILWSSPEIKPSFLETLEKYGISEEDLTLSDKDTAALPLTEWMKAHKAI